MHVVSIMYHIEHKIKMEADALSLVNHISKIEI